jgi:hypothetical protein
MKPIRLALEGSDDCDIVRLWSALRVLRKRVLFDDDDNEDEEESEHEHEEEVCER